MAKEAQPQQRWYHPDELASAMWAEHGLPSDPALGRYNPLYYGDGQVPMQRDGKIVGYNLLEFDFNSGQNDKLHRCALSSGEITLDEKLAITNRLFEAVFRRETRLIPQWNHQFFPGLWVKPDNTFSQSLLDVFPYRQGEVVSSGRVQSWEEQKNVVDAQLDAILKNKRPAFLVMHSVTASLGMLSLAERPELLNRENFHIVLINPDANPKERADHSPTLRIGLQKMRPDLTPEEIDEFLASFPKAWDDHIQQAFKMYGKSKNISIIVGQDDEIVPSSVLGDEKANNVHKIPHFGHMTEKNSHEVFAKVQEIMHTKTAEQKPPLDQNRVGALLRTATELYKKEDTPQELKDELRDLLKPKLLEEIAEESSRQRWTAENTEAAMHAYCNFLTIERLFGEREGRRLYREIVKRLITARQLDIYVDRSAGRIASEQRGTAIYLSARGADMTQAVAQFAYLKACDEMDALGVIAPYYRDQILTTNLGDDSEDPKHRLASKDETVAELIRVKGAPGGDGKDLPAKGGIIDTDGEISILRGTANVGGHIEAASGYADKLRLRAIRNEGIEYDEPKRADAYRDIQVANTHGAVLISLGDGAVLPLDGAFDLQINNRLPVINLIQNNEKAIGVKLIEVTSQPELWQRGHGKGVPGIRIEETNPDGLFLAMYFATKYRALSDAGPTIIEAMVRRLLAHSTSHGDPETAECVFRAWQFLTEQAEKFFQTDPRKAELQNYIKSSRGLMVPSKDDNQIRVSERLTKLLTTTLIDDPLVREGIQKIIDEIVDPTAYVLKDLQKKGYISAEEVKLWSKEAGDKIDAIVEEVLTRPRPDPKTATRNIRLVTPEITGVPYSHEKLTLNISEAIRLAQAEAMEENPNVLVLGTDVVKGLGIHGDRFIQEGGYFNQQDGLFEKFGKLPHRITNMPINELSVIKYLMGMSTTFTGNGKLDETNRILYDPQYIDYGVEGLPGLYVQGNRLYLTDGKITITFGMLLLSGSAPGAGPMHAGELASMVYQTPSSVDVFYASDPETVYKGLKCNMLYNNNPYMFMVDKTRIYERKTFERGTGLLPPGKARVVKEGKVAQIIGFGPMINKTMDVLNSGSLRPVLEETTGVLDLVSLRPFPYEDVKKFLKEGSGPIFIVHEEPIGKWDDDTSEDPQEPIIKGFAAQIASLLVTNPELYEIVKDRLPIYPIGSKPVPVIPCDKNLNPVPTAERVYRKLTAYERDRRGKQRRYLGNNDGLLNPYSRYNVYQRKVT